MLSNSKARHKITKEVSKTSHEGGISWKFGEETGKAHIYPALKGSLEVFGHFAWWNQKIDFSLHLPNYVNTIIEHRLASQKRQERRRVFLGQFRDPSSNCSCAPGTRCLVCLHCPGWRCELQRKTRAPRVHAFGEEYSRPNDDVAYDFGNCCDRRPGKGQHHPARPC